MTASLLPATLAEAKPDTPLGQFLAAFVVRPDKLLALTNEFEATFRQLAAESPNQFLPTPIPSALLAPISELGKREVRATRYEIKPLLPSLASGAPGTSLLSQGFCSTHASRSSHGLLTESFTGIWQSTCKFLLARANYFMAAAVIFMPMRSPPSCGCSMSIHGPNPDENILTHSA